MRISDWSSDVCSSDLWLSTERHSVRDGASQYHGASHRFFRRSLFFAAYSSLSINPASCNFLSFCRRAIRSSLPGLICCSSAITLGEPLCSWAAASSARSEEHTSELQSLMRISYAVFCLKKKKQLTHHT